MIGGVTAYLMRPGSGDARADVLAEDADYDEVPLRADLPYAGALFVARREAGEPDWAEFVREIAQGDVPDLTSRLPAVALAIAIDDRYLAVTFGLGRLLVDVERAEQDFGLKVTLNTVDPAQLLSLDTAAIEDLVVRTRRQVSRGSEAHTFGIDDRRDMFRAVVGTPRDATFGRRVGGSTSVRVTRRIESGELATFGRRLVNAYGALDYEAAFGFIDQVRPVALTKDTEPLDELLLASLRGTGPKSAVDPYLAPPGIVEWDEIGGFRYPNERKNDD